jgi:hypothetical protein
MDRNRWIEVITVALALVIGVGHAYGNFKLAVSTFPGENKFLALAMAMAEAALKTDAQNSQSKAALAFDKLKTLVGHWEAPMPTGTAQEDYQLLAGGTVLVSHDKIPGEPEMLTVYHLDSDRLLLTHYCSAGNQPHMQAENFDAASNELRFIFVDATNLANENAGHMHRAVFRFNGADDVTQEWTWYQDGKVSFSEPLKYHRVK